MFGQPSACVRGQAAAQSLGGHEGETARLPLSETPCASCTSILDSLDGAAVHLTRRLSLAVVAKSDPDRIRNFAHERGWRHLRLLSSRRNAYNRDYHGEATEGEQMPVLNVFVRDGDQFRHTWASELMYAPRDEGQEARHVDSIWPIWNVLDVAPEGRGNEPNFPALRLQLSSARTASLDRVPKVPLRTGQAHSDPRGLHPVVSPEFRADGGRLPRRAEQR